MTDHDSTPQGFRRLKIAVLLAIAELLAIIVAYQLMASIECRLTEIELACRALRSLTARAFAVLAVIFLFFQIRPKSYRHLGQITNTATGSPVWLALHFTGVALIFLPLVMFGAAEMNRAIAPSLAIMLPGGGLAAIGLLRWLAPMRSWVGWLKSDHYYLPLTLIGAALVPDLAEALRPAWNLTNLSELTFALVYLSLSGFGSDIWVDPSIYVIGLEGFNVQIGLQCAGVEGVALIAIFMGLYAVMMRGDIRQVRYWGVLFPLAILTSWLFNIARIAGLILIGARVSPEHALNGFHSYAGWLLFTCLALGIIYVAHHTRWFHALPKQLAPVEPPKEPFAQNQIAATIAPFIVMMLSGVVAAAFWADPQSGYPLRVLAMGTVLFYFRAFLIGLPWSLSTVAVISGGLIGLGWLMPDLVGSNSASTDSPSRSGIWIASRLLGTVLLVPIIEELFFRGYLLRRLDWGGLGMRLLAIALSSVLFGLMHDRLIAGVAAGVVFALVYLWRGRLTDAIGAHITANAVIAVWALIQSDWTLI